MRERQEPGAGRGRGPRRSGRDRLACPAAPCSQTAAQAASKAGTPWARRPAAMPASTSPEPAVASQGGALALIARRPSGAATTVSAPLRMTTAPAAGGGGAGAVGLGAGRRGRGRGGRTRRRAGSGSPAPARAAMAAKSGGGRRRTRRSGRRRRGRRGGGAARAAATRARSRRAGAEAGAEGDGGEARVGEHFGERLGVVDAARASPRSGGRR